MPTEHIVPQHADPEVIPDYAKRWQVVLHNDDFHTFEFVIMLVMEIFGHDLENAVVLTYTVHQEGRARVATCSKERAELYLEQVASKHEYRGDESLGPLSASMEPIE
jgi:ATP-dependent Clp protease adaptor protein ClpS